MKSRKLIEQLFSGGKSFSIHPFKIFYLVNENVFSALQKKSFPAKKIILQCGVGVSSKNFKKAVDRNRVKRLMRETYRLQKNFLYDALKEKNLQLALFIIYTGKELPEYKMVSDKIDLILHRIAKEFQKIDT